MGAPQFDFRTAVSPCSIKSMGISILMVCIYHHLIISADIDSLVAPLSAERPPDSLVPFPATVPPRVRTPKQTPHPPNRRVEDLFSPLEQVRSCWIWERSAWTGCERDRHTLTTDSLSILLTPQPRNRVSLPPGSCLALWETLLKWDGESISNP